MVSGPQKINLFAFNRPDIGQILDGKHDKESTLYDSWYDSENSGMAYIFGSAAKDEAQERFLEPIYEEMKKALIAEKHLDSHQQTIVANRIKEIVEQAELNLGLGGTMKQSEIKISDLQKIRNEVKKIVLCVGNSRPLFPAQEGEDPSPMSNVFQTLLSENPSAGDVLNSDTASSVLWGRDPKFLKEARDYVQDMFDRFTAYPPERRSQRLANEASIENLLALYPFFDPEAGETLNVPEKIDGKWTSVPYEVEKIQLTQNWLASPMFAYGLVPKEHKDKAAPKLLFKGTTYPVDRGAFLSLLSDTNPFASVGEYAFNMGFSELEKWFEKNTSEEVKADVMGQSLGGSLTLLASANFGDKIRKAHAFNPPAPFPWSISNFDSYQEHQRPDVRVFCQSGDVIPKLGWGWHPAWKVHKVFTSRDDGAFFSHAKAFTAESDVLILDVNPEMDSSSFSRKIIAIIQLVVSPILFVVLAIFFFIHRVLYAIYNGIKKAILYMIPAKTEPQPIPV